MTLDTQCGKVFKCFGQIRENTMTRNEIETALDRGTLKVRQRSGTLWSVRRNGRTQTWKTRPNDFRIPIKIGFRSYGYIDQDNINSEELVIG